MASLQSFCFSNSNNENEEKKEEEEVVPSPSFSSSSSQLAEIILTSSIYLPLFLTTPDIVLGIALTSSTFHSKWKGFSKLQHYPHCYSPASSFSPLSTSPITPENVSSLEDLFEPTDNNNKSMMMLKSGWAFASLVVALPRRFLPNHEPLKQAAQNLRHMTLFGLFGGLEDLTKLESLTYIQSFSDPIDPPPHKQSMNCFKHFPHHLKSFSCVSYVPIALLPFSQHFETSLTHLELFLNHNDTAVDFSPLGSITQLQHLSIICIRDVPFSHYFDTLPCNELKTFNFVSEAAFEDGTEFDKNENWERLSQLENVSIELPKGTLSLFRGGGWGQEQQLNDNNTNKNSLPPLKTIRIYVHNLVVVNNDSSMLFSNVTDLHLSVGTSTRDLECALSSLPPDAKQNGGRCGSDGDALKKKKRMFFSLSELQNIKSLTLRVCGYEYFPMPNTTTTLVPHFASLVSLSLGWGSFEYFANNTSSQQQRHKATVEEKEEEESKQNIVKEEEEEEVGGGKTVIDFDFYKTIRFLTITFAKLDVRGGETIVLLLNGCEKFENLETLKVDMGGSTYSPGFMSLVPAQYARFFKLARDCLFFPGLFMCQLNDALSQFHFPNKKNVGLFTAVQEFYKQEKEEEALQQKEKEDPSLLEKKKKKNTVTFMSAKEGHKYYMKMAINRNVLCDFTIYKNKQESERFRSIGIFMPRRFKFYKNNPQ